MRHTRLPGLLATALGTALLTGGLTGCTGGPPDPQPAADALAQALAAGDLGDVSLTAADTQAAQDELSSALSGVEPASRQVAVQAVEQQSAADGTPQALVDLTITWDLDGPGPAEPGWSYPTTATLVLDEQADPAQWRTDWSLAVLHPDLAAGTSLVAERVQPARADILGAGGVPLVTERGVQRVGIDKVRLADADPEAAARELAEVVGVDADSFAERVSAAGEQAFVEAIVLRDAAAEPLRAEVEAVPGGRLLPDALPLAPSREFARALLGTVGEATAEIVEGSDGAIAAGDLVGLSGLQAAYDEQLRGVPGVTVRVRDADGVVGDAVHSRGPRPGEPLRLTLDRATQQLADDVLADVASPSALVALRPSTGQVLAAASGPGSDGYSTATLGQYPPGSVFKIVSALALLRAGQQPQTALPCTETITVDGKVFTNYSDFPPSALGEMPLSRAFAESCNTAFVSQADQLDPDSLAAAATSLGIGGWSDLGFDASAGSVGSPAGPVEQAATMIGQGSVLLSPLAAATMTSAAAGGQARPWLVRDAEPEPGGAEPVTAQESRALLAMMRAAVTDGTADVLAGLPGPPVAAKTGTAEYGRQQPPDTHGWMVAVQGDLAVAVFVEQAESGSVTAGPVLASFLSGLPPSARG